MSNEQMRDWPRALPPWPESEPHQARLTLKQFILLVHVLIKNYDDFNKPASFTWSPKTFLGRAPTASESVTLSKRLKSLVAAEYVKKSGRSIEISELGKNVLLVNSYWLEKGRLDPRLAEKARAYLEVLDRFKEEAAIEEVRTTARALRRDLLVGELDSLVEEVRQMKQDALRRLDVPET